MESEKSVSFVSSTLIGRDEEAKLQQLLSGLINAYDSIAFREPVDWKALNLMDYPTIITNPMDLSTVKRKIATKSYENVEDCLEDINLIWENAKTYNPKEHVKYIHNLGYSQIGGQVREANEENDQKLLTLRENLNSSFKEKNRKKINKTCKRANKKSRAQNIFGKTIIGKE